MTELHTLEAGRIVDGKYQIVSLLGQGGMGAVYEALHTGTHRRVALKVIVSAALANEPDVIERFKREAKASGAIDSLHVVQVLDTGVDPASNSPYMVMEYLAGEDLVALVRRVGPLAPDVVVRIGVQACLGLQRAHEAGIVHRDIKSANMFLARRDNGEVQLKLLDFGIAKVRAEPVPGQGTDHGLTTTGSMLGSPLYMSPEQARSTKNLDGRADLWSLAVALYEALVGETPFHDKVTLADLLLAICIEPTPSLHERAPWVPHELVSIIERALEKDPARRFESAAEMQRALAALALGGSSLREEMLVALTPEARASRPSRRSGEAVATDPGVVPSALAPQASPPLDRTVNDAAVAVGVTKPGLADSHGMHGTSRPHKAYWALLAAPVLLIGSVAIVVSGRLSSTAKAPVAAASSATTESVAPDPPALSSSPPPSPPAPLKSAALAIIAPAGATATVDGIEVPILDGAVAIAGPPGAKHEVRVVSGDATKEASVVVVDDGTTLPPKLELVAKRGSPRPKTTPAVASSTKRPPAEPPTTKPNEPAVKTSFD